MEYRCNVFGYLAHPWLTAESGLSGNYGTLDQIAALDWVYENIAGFGSNPENITVFGQSAELWYMMGTLRKTEFFRYGTERVNRFPRR